ncbi:MAG: AbrB/MazE/SpoVT family DNA-binding domain-containing protein [Gammaproteobacteria bacterium]|nr:AbrB/MazE/SpoVT family DNA-binding domain-containing protein [Gammaproteobacteria bacterium]
MQDLNISLGQNGRIVIPASVRKLLELKEGQRLRLHLEDKKIVLEKTDDVIQKLKNRFSFIDESLSEELVQDRRKAAEKENQ